MTPNTNTARWLKPVLIATAITALLLLWAHLAGGIFLIAFDRPFDDASPFTLLQYWHYHGQEKTVSRWLLISSGISLAVLALPLLLIFAGKKKKSLFGDARFASRHEIRKAGLFNEKGLIVGRIGSKYLVFGGSQHILLSAPTRSGKGVGVVIPNLLHWPDSVVVLDVKQENWGITSGYRARHGQACYLFNPLASDCRTHRYNPLSYLSDDPYRRIDDIGRIASMLFPDRPGTDTIWTATPRSLFIGIVMYLLETPGKPVTLGQVLRETLVCGDGSEHFARIIHERTDSSMPLSGNCVRSLNSYVSIASDNTRSGIMTGFRAAFELWMNPLVDAATSENDFDLREVRKQRMSVYVGITPDNLDRAAPLINLFFQQLIDLNTRELPEHNRELRYTCLLLMDEFTTIGRIPVLSKGIGYMAGYGLRMMPVIQSPSQLVDVYGKDAAQTFHANHALQIVFPPKASESATARDISEWLGYQTVKGISESRSKGFTGSAKSENVSAQRRALLLPQEITGLGQDKELVVMENIPPILAEKVVYYQDKTFINRLESVSRDPDGRSAPVPRIDPAAHDASISTSTTAGTTTKNSQGGIAREARKHLAAFTLDIASDRDDSTDHAALHGYVDSLCREAGIDTEPEHLTHG